MNDTAEQTHSSSANASYIIEQEDVSTADPEAPSIPSGLSTKMAGKNIKLHWNASTDNIGVSGDAVWRNGSRIGDSTDTGYVDGTASAGTFNYSVSAYDAAGNMSPLSSAVTVVLTEKTNEGKPPKK